MEGYKRQETTACTQENSIFIHHVLMQIKQLETHLHVRMKESHTHRHRDLHCTCQCNRQIATYTDPIDNYMSHVLWRKGGASCIVHNNSSNNKKKQANMRMEYLPFIYICTTRLQNPTEWILNYLNHLQIL